MNSCSTLPNRHRQAIGFKLVLGFLLLALCTFTVAPAAWSQESTGTPPASNTEGGDASSAGMQAAAGLSNLLYFPAKLVFALSGSIVGGLAYVFSGGNEQAAKSIWFTSLYGTYIVTPDHLQGNKPIRFLGVADSQDAPAPEPAR